MIEWDTIGVTFLLWTAIVPIEAYWILWWFDRKYHLGGVLRILSTPKESLIDKVKKVIR